jgi:hypothetical protein
LPEYGIFNSEVDEAARGGSGFVFGSRTAAILIVVGFFLPWVGCGSAEPSGFELGCLPGFQFVWAIPACAFVALFGLRGAVPRTRSPRTRARIVLWSGAMGTLATLACMSLFTGKWIPFGAHSSNLRYGIWTSFTASALLAALGWREHRRLGNGTSNAPPPDGEQ